MAKIYSDITELIGGTPLVRLSRFAPGMSVLAKLERQNPAGSAKDRVALSMLRTAEAEGRLKKGGVVIEPTSGNTGIGLAALAAALGYKAVIVMPDSMSPERIKLIAAYGAEVVLTPGAEGMAGAVARADEICAANPGSIVAGQFSNPANPRAHYETTGPEIWRDTDGDVAAFVAGVGTGGTISGVGRYLKEQDPAIRIVAMEPASSPPAHRGPRRPSRHPGHRRKLRPRGAGHYGLRRGRDRHRRGGARRHARARGKGGPPLRRLLRRGGVRGAGAGEAAGVRRQEHSLPPARHRRAVSEHNVRA